MSTEKTYMQLETSIVTVLQTIFDPEIPVNIYDLGLIYEIKVNDDNKVDILMTLTSPNCPVAESLPREVKANIEDMKEVTEVNLTLTFDPPWTKDMLSEEAMLELGFL